MSQVCSSKNLPIMGCLMIYNVNKLCVTHTRAPINYKQNRSFKLTSRLYFSYTEILLLQHLDYLSALKLAVKTQT